MLKRIIEARAGSCIQSYLLSFTQVFLDFFWYANIQMCLYCCTLLNVLCQIKQVLNLFNYNA